MTKLTMRILIFSFVFSIPPLAMAEEPLEIYIKTSNELLEHLNESIPVLELGGGEFKSEQERLTNRLEALQNKKISNREWSEFWQEHANLSEKLVETLELLSPETLEINRRTLSEKLKALEEQERGPQIILNLRINTLKQEIRELISQNDRFEARTDNLKKTLEKLGQTAASLAEEGDTKKTATLREAISDTERQIEALANSIRDNEASLLKKENRLETLRLDPTSLSTLNDTQKNTDIDDELQTAINTLKRRALEKAKGIDLGGQILQTKKRLAQLELLRGASLLEKVFLTKWRLLAQDKVKSQDVYLQAIEQELEAVEERLRSFVKKTDDMEVTKVDEDPCNPSIANSDTPFFNHRSCVEQLKKASEALSRSLSQTSLELALYERFASTNLKLIEAQTRDVELVKRERALSAEGVALNPRNQAWTEVWTAYHDRGAKKVKNLESALYKSKKDKRMVKAKLAVLSVAKERIGSEREALSKQLDRQRSFLSLLKAIGLTIFSIIQVGWPALVYIVLAMVTIRIVRNVRDKKERESEQVDSGQTHDRLVELEKALRAAQDTDDEASVMSIHEEIGIVESQLKDQGQRVATIARVAAQAISLVIYVATTLLVLDALTVDIGPILGGAAIFGLAISFGSQSLVKDVVSGFFILLENQYAVGDVVDINGKSGSVEKVTLRRTVLRNSKGEVHNLTNGSISSVTNMTQGWARVVMHLGVAYGTDIDFVKSVVNEVGEQMYKEEEWRSKLTEKPSFVGVTAFGESEITIRVWCKTKTFQNWGVERELNIRLKTAFERANIEIPFPKRDINLIISKPELEQSLKSS